MLKLTDLPPGPSMRPDGKFRQRLLHRSGDGLPLCVGELRNVLFREPRGDAVGGHDEPGGRLLVAERALGMHQVALLIRLLFEVLLAGLNLLDLIGIGGRDINQIVLAQLVQDVPGREAELVRPFNLVLEHAVDDLEPLFLAALGLVLASLQLLLEVSELLWSELRDVNATCDWSYGCRRFCFLGRRC